jgi:hypothetical protein
LDFSSNAALARFGYALGIEAQNSAVAFRWRPGDEFEARRKRDEAALGDTP